MGTDLSHRHQCTRVIELWCDTQTTRHRGSTSVIEKKRNETKWKPLTYKEQRTEGKENVNPVLQIHHEEAKVPLLCLYSRTNKRRLWSRSKHITQ